MTNLDKLTHHQSTSKNTRDFRKVADILRARGIYELAVKWNGRTFKISRTTNHLRIHEELGKAQLAVPWEDKAALISWLLEEAE